MMRGHFILVFLTLFGALAVVGGVGDGRPGLALVGVVLIAAGIPVAHKLGRAKERLKWLEDEIRSVEGPDA